MDLGDGEEQSTEANGSAENVNFDQVTAVASGWMFDCMFVSLCRYFKEGKVENFNQALSVFEAITESPSLLKTPCNNKILISAFLARVIHGEQLEVLFEEDERVMPLMSASKIWLSLEDCVADASLYKEITLLLLVQSVAVCLEKGQKPYASFALEWLEEHHELPQSLRVKLSTIVTKRDTYHPFVMSFSFKCLMEKIYSFLDKYLENNPSDYLLKAATKTVQSSTGWWESLDQVSLQDRPSSKSQENTVQEDKKTKKKRLFTKNNDLWKPERTKSAIVSVTRLHINDLSQRMSKCEKSIITSTQSNSRKRPQKWTSQLDQYLKDGVRRHGVGKWSKILNDYNFEGRTGIMLKDRWRVLVKSDLVD